MSQSVLEMAKELSLALIGTGNVPAEDMQDTLQKTHSTLLTLKAQEEFGTATAPSVVSRTAADWRKSITKQAVTCLECGKTFKQLSTRHLMMHGLDGRSYRAKYGIPRTQSLAAKTTSARRRAVVQAVRPWEKTPTFRKGQERDGKAPAEEALAASEAAKASAAAAPATVKRARKTASKKTARKKSSNG